MNMPIAMYRLLLYGLKITSLSALSLLDFFQSACNRCPVQHFDACFNLWEVAIFKICVTDSLTD